MIWIGFPQEIVEAQERRLEHIGLLDWVESLTDFVVDGNSVCPEKIGCAGAHERTVYLNKPSTGWLTTIVILHEVGHIEQGTGWDWDRYKTDKLFYIYTEIDASLRAIRALGKWQ